MKKLSRIARQIFFEEYIGELLYYDDELIADFIVSVKNAISKSNAEFKPRYEELLEFLQEWHNADNVGRVELWNKHLHRSI